MKRIAVYLFLAALAVLVIGALAGCKPDNQCATPCDCTTPVDRPCDTLTTGP